MKPLMMLEAEDSLMSSIRVNIGASDLLTQAGSPCNGVPWILEAINAPFLEYA